MIGNEPDALAIEALDGLDSFDDAAWSFTKTTTGRDGSRIERHDATKPEGQRWGLVRIDGREPTPREVEKYRREKGKGAKKSDEGASDDPGIDRETIRLVTETPERMAFSFQPESEGFASRFAGGILGTLVVNRDGGWLERLEIENRKELSPIPGVKFSEFHFTKTFHRDEDSGVLLPRSIEMHVRGRAFLFKSLDDDRVAHLTDYARVRPSTTNSQ